MLAVNKSSSVNINLVVSARFQLGLSDIDKALLEKLQTYFCVGRVQKMGSKAFQYRVDTVKDLKVIINHFDKNPLKTQKLADYKLFNQALIFYFLHR